MARTGVIIRLDWAKEFASKLVHEVAGRAQFLAGLRPLSFMWALSESCLRVLTTTAAGKSSIT